MEAQLKYTYTLHKLFFTFGADLYAKLVLINKISASELSRKFIKSALLVGYFFVIEMPLCWILSLATLKSCYCEIHCLWLLFPRNNNFFVTCKKKKQEQEQKEKVWPFLTRNGSRHNT